MVILLTEDSSLVSSEAIELDDFSGASLILRVAASVVAASLYEQGKGNISSITLKFEKV